MHTEGFVNDMQADSDPVHRLQNGQLLLFALQQLPQRFLNDSGHQADHGVAGEPDRQEGGQQLLRVLPVLKKIFLRRHDDADPAFHFARHVDLMMTGKASRLCLNRPHEPQHRVSVILRMFHVFLRAALKGEQGLDFPAVRRVVRPFRIKTGDPPLNGGQLLAQLGDLPEHVAWIQQSVRPPGNHDIPLPHIKVRIGRRVFCHRRIDPAMREIPHAVEHVFLPEHSGIAFRQRQRRFFQMPRVPQKQGRKQKRPAARQCQQHSFETAFRCFFSHGVLNSRLMQEI